MRNKTISPLPTSVSGELFPSEGSGQFAGQSCGEGSEQSGGQSCGEEPEQSDGQSCNEEQEDRWKKESDRIQELYLVWMKDPSDENFEQFYHQIQPYLRRVLSTLKYDFPRVYDSNWEDALQYVWVQLFIVLKRQKNEQIPADSILAFSRHLCRLKACSFFISAQRRANRYPSSQISLPDGQDILDLTEKSDAEDPDAQSISSNPPFSALEQELRKDFFGQILLLYCRTLFDYPGEPPRSLALFFVRLFPHLCREMAPGGSLPGDRKDLSQDRVSPKSVSEKTASQTQWALGFMKGKTVASLMDEAQSATASFFSTPLFWAESLVQQLKSPYPGFPVRLCLGELVYTDCFPKKQISHWSEDFHKTIYKQTAKAILKDPTLSALLSVYSEERNLTAMNLAHAAILRRRSSGGSPQSS